MIVYHLPQMICLVIAGTLYFFDKGGWWIFLVVAILLAPIPNDKGKVK